MGTSRLKRYFWETLPGYFVENDTYKASDPLTADRGLLQRYLLAIQEECESIESDITSLSNQAFPLSCEESLLTYIAELYGNPPDTFGDVDWYRALLRNIIQINKHKGTVRGFEEFFSIMGTTIEITVTLASYYQYDQAGIRYDGAGVHHDGFCDPCVTLDFNIVAGSPIPGISGATYSDNLRRNIQSILLYLMPINAKVGTFSYDSSARDISLTPNITKFAS